MKLIVILMAVLSIIILASILVYAIKATKEVR